MPVKLIVQIPCLNEAETIAETIRGIPRSIAGVDAVEVLVIDDGSRDGTSDVALAAGADHIVRHRGNMGLGWAFRSGLDACLARGADIIVNTDADNQYAASSIPDLIGPILDGRADIVVGDRRPSTLPHFSWAKRRLQKLGTFAVASLSGLDVGDAVSGFRALSREAAIRTVILSPFSYTIEMLIQAGRKRMSVVSVPVSTNKVERRSRLIRSVPNFIARSVTLMTRAFAMYHPVRIFAFVGLLLFLVGTVPIVRFLIFAAMGQSGGHVQSLILGGVLVVLGFLAMMFGLLADLIGFNRQLLELVIERTRTLDYGRRPGGEPERTSGGEPPNSGRRPQR